MIAGAGGRPMSVASPSAANSFLARRSRVLAHLQPLLDIEHAKIRSTAADADRDWGDYDTRLLQLVAFDAIAAEDGLHPEGGVPRETVERQVAIHAERMASNQPPADHSHVAAWLIDRLLNAGTSARGFDVSWVDPSDAYRRDDLRVTALYETLTAAGDVRLHAGKAALNLTLAGLDLDLEDRQIAAEAVLRAQIESGRWSQAEQTATATMRIAVEYRSRLDDILRSVERDLRDTNWEEDVESALDKSLTHVADRVTVSYQLSDHAQQLAEDVDPEHRAQAASVVRLVHDTLTQLLTLQRSVIDARDRFRAAQVTQGFAVSLSVGIVHLRDEVFGQMLAFETETAARLAPAVVAPFAAPSAPPVVSLSDMLETLLARPREREGLTVEIDSGDLYAIENPFERFDDDVWATAHSIMKGVGASVRLSDLTKEHDDEVSLLVALQSMRCWGEHGLVGTRDPMLVGIVAVDDGTPFCADRFIVPDLVLARPDHEDRADAR